MPIAPPKHKGGTLHLPEGRASAAKRGYGRQHRKWRGYIIARDPVCKCVGHPGCEHESRECGHSSTQADHIDGNNTNLSQDNGQGLCIYCHSRKTAHDPKGETYRGLRAPHAQGCDVDGVPHGGHWRRPSHTGQG